MALDKAIASGKERRKPYRKSKAVDRSCRHGGNCGWCEGNRTINNRRQMSAREQQRNGADVREDS